jgi:malic enzyme
MDYFKKSLILHKKYHGKLCTKEKVSLENSEDLSTYYSP